MNEPVQETITKNLNITRKLASPIIIPALPGQKPEKKRCKKGTRRNKKTGECEPYIPKKGAIITPDDASLPDEKPANAALPESLPVAAALPESLPNKQPVNLQPSAIESISSMFGLSPNSQEKEEEEEVEKQISINPPILNQELAKKVKFKTNRKIIISQPTVLPPVTEKEVASVNPEPLNPEKIETPLPEITEDFNLEDHLGKLDTDSNEYLREKERVEYKFNAEDKSPDYEFLYPELNDPNFNIKIAKRKEFNDTQYDGTIRDIKEYAERMCSAEFELMPHQLFVKNFLSFQTPYNSLLLYHGLGTGKTCSSIGIAEEMRNYMKQLGIRQRIIVVASPNVQDNFRMQLFDEKKLKFENNMWSIQSCIGNSLLKEINPTSMTDMTKAKIISNIKTIINNYYVFMGYVEFANYISKKTSVSIETGFSDQERHQMKIKNIKRVFNSRLIIIDEVHNIRITDENKNKRIAQQLFELAKHADNLRFLFLSATPMYNTYKEIIWLTNLMNLNDGRSQIDITEVFDKDGQFREPKPGQEGGRELLQRKLIGYVSYIRGENPYTFPYRIYPNTFAPEHTFRLDSDEREQILVYPTIQLNNVAVDEPLKYLNVYVSQTGDYQENGYSYIVNSMRNKAKQSHSADTELPNSENLDSFGYTLLMSPLEALNIVYPNPELDRIWANRVQSPGEDFGEDLDGPDIIADLVGKQGLNNIMNSIDDSAKKNPQRYNFEYKPKILSQYGRIFHQEHLHKYSSKIAAICECIRKSDGIVLIYSQYIDGGVVPIALALEEMGFLRYSSAQNTKSLFKKPPTELLDAAKMLPKSQVPAKDFRQARYMMITGDKSFSPNNAADIKYAVDPENRDGHNVKVILISKAGSEGLDFKCIRQVHIMEPWYNMNRIEQIIGRGVRNLSHCYLPFEKRNVELYLHSSVMARNTREECADLYVYRLAEKKAIQIGRVTRLLKENSVDCILNIAQSNFTVAKLNELAANQEIELQLSSGDKIKYLIGDKKFTDICDYMDNCDYKCSPTAEIAEGDIIKDTYNNDFVSMNNTRIMERIRQLFKERHVYKREQLISAINIVKQYPLEQIYYALSAFIKNENELLVDKYGRLGRLVDKYSESDDTAYYSFQPVEITDENASVYDRSAPVEYKRAKLALEIPGKISAEEEEVAPKPNIVKTQGVEMLEMSVKEPGSKYTEILAQFKENIDYIYTNREVPSAEKEWDWYMHARKVYDHINTVYGISQEIIYKYFVYHIIDTLLFHQKMTIISQIYTPSWRPTEKYAEIEEIMKEYFDSILLQSPKKRGILLNKDNSWKIMVQSADVPESWYEGEPEDTNLFAPEIMKLIVPTKSLTDRVGFFALFKNTEMVFYVKDMSKTRNSGARCDSAGKVRIIELLNHIQKRTVYTPETAKFIAQMGLCIILEIVMRNMTKPGSVNFLRPEQATLIKIKEL